MKQPHKVKKLHVDLSKEIFIRVNGEDEKDNIISWSKLKSIGDKLEDLIISLARHSSKDINSVDLSNFKLEFLGFYKGSAIPAFKLQNSIPNLFNYKEVEKDVNQNFSMIMQSIDKEDYNPIINTFNNDEAKVEIINKIYEFTNSAGTSPVSIVKKSSKKNNEFIDIYRVHSLKPQARDTIIGISNKIGLKPDIETTGIGKVTQIKSGKTGRIRNKVLDVLKEDGATMAIEFSKIETENKVYIFNNPILFQFDKDKSGCIIENKQLDLFASGKTKEEAKEKLFYQFDHSYTRFNELQNNQLSPYLLQVKNYYNFIIKSVING